MNVVDVTLLVTAALERCDVAYFLGGSLASSIHGEPRATNDVDVVVDLAESDVAPLAAALGPDFDLDPNALRLAVRERRSLNVLFKPLVTKIDLFVRGEAPFDRSEFERRRRVEVRAGRSLFIKSPEDSALRKLLWFRSGGSVSERQWRDVVQVLRRSRALLDVTYLDVWAERLALSGLLSRARAEAAAAGTDAPPGPARAASEARRPSALTDSKHPLADTTELTVTLPGGKKIDAALGDFVVRTDQPVSNGGEGEAPSPFQLFLASLGTCAGIYVAGFCQKRGVPTEGIRLLQRNAFDPETGVLASVDLEIHVPGGFPEKYLEALVRVVDQCAVKKAIQAQPRFSVRTVVA